MNVSRWDGRRWTRPAPILSRESSEVTPRITDLVPGPAGEIFAITTDGILRSPAP